MISIPAKTAKAQREAKKLGLINYEFLINQTISSTPSISFASFWFVEGFIFSFEGNEEEFKQNVLSMSREYFPDLYINIETFKGERIYNWGN